MREPMKRPGSIRPENVIVGALYSHKEWPGVIYKGVITGGGGGQMAKGIIVFKSPDKDDECVGNEVTWRGDFWKGFSLSKLPTRKRRNRRA